MAAQDQPRSHRWLTTSRSSPMGTVCCLKVGPKRGLRPCSQQLRSARPGAVEVGRDDGRVSPRRPAPGPRELEAAIEQLQELYAQLPALSCLGLCEASCVSTSTPPRRTRPTPGRRRRSRCPHTRRSVPGADADVRGRAVQRARHPPHHLPAVGCHGLDALPARLPARGRPGR